MPQVCPRKCKKNANISTNEMNKSSSDWTTKFNKYIEIVKTIQVPIKMDLNESVSQLQNSW